MNRIMNLFQKKHRKTEIPAIEAAEHENRQNKKDPADYESVFLVNIPCRIRCQTYINMDLYDKLRQILPVLSPEITITGFVNNVLEHHLKQYQDEINELYAKNFSPKPIDF